MRMFQFVFVSLLALPFFAEIARGAELVHAFSSWRIKHHTETPENIAYSLVGLGDVTDLHDKFLGYRTFDLTCYPNEPGRFKLIIPYDKRVLEKKHKVVINLLVWGDNQEASEIIMVRFGKRVLFSVYTGSEIGSEVGDEAAAGLVTFMTTLERSKKAFSFGFGGKSLEFDTNGFAPAWKVFKQLCHVPPAVFSSK